MINIRIDIVSDVVCPWCIIGYKRLEQALDQLDGQVNAIIQWHPFELNPAIGAEGQNLREHLAEKYGTSVQASAAARDSITQLGKEVNFQFNFHDQMRIYNTRHAHQLLMWSSTLGLQLALNMALFKAYFTEGKDISDDQVLLDIADKVGLNRTNAQLVIDDTNWTDAVASTEQQWLDAGINAVPAIIINRKHLISGAQTVDVLTNALRQMVDMDAK